jgi:hypothetical protein
MKYKKLYIIGTTDNKVKIGISNNPIDRLTQLESAGGFTTKHFLFFSLDNPSEIEIKLHESFSESRCTTTTGVVTEWFTIQFDQVVTRLQEIIQTPLGIVAASNQVGVDEGDKLELKFLSLIKDHYRSKRRGITKTELVNITRFVTSSDRDKLIKKLVIRGRLLEEFIQGDRGSKRPVTRYTLVK